MKPWHKLRIAGLGVFALAVVLVLIASGGQNSLAADGIIYVDADAASGANNGSTWADAYTGLQAALDAAVSGDEIWVAAGTYTPTVEYGGSGERYRSFQLRNGVALYGGFDPDMGDVGWEDRDWKANLTILSGDLAGDDGPGFENNGENSYHVFYHPAGTDLDSTALLDGFTISGGNADGVDPEYLGSGGGMFNYGSSPALANCTFADNSARRGGGMYNEASSPALTNCIFEGNSAIVGGGMANREGSSPALTNCTFTGNSANEHGGMENFDSSPTLTNCTFSGNSADDQGGGMFNYHSSPALINCTFSGNSAGWEGGGMANLSYSSPTLTNCILWGNVPDEIYDYSFSSPDVTYSDVQGGYSGMGNIAEDPRFVDPGNGDLHLGPDSPCIDVGNNYAPGLPASDFEGDGRILDGNGDGMAIVDMGVDEVVAPTPPVIFVDLEATGANSGKSWQDALTDLQDALAWAEAGVEIWVAEGTYTPTVEYGGSGDRYRSFQLKNGVALYGGFDPDAGDVAFQDRDWGSNETILSGDLAGDDGPEFENNGENCYHVFYHPDGTNLDSSAVLDGFTLSGGNANGDSHPHTAGGAVFNHGSSPALTNCTFEGNSASFGGGMWNQDSSTTLTGCHFSGNSAGAAGGGIYNWLASPALTDCTFAENSALYHGGGIFNNESSPVLANCTFSGNWSLDDGGGMTNGGDSSPVLTNCTFSDNSASDTGGGMYNDGATPTLTNCTFAGNSASAGGGLYSHSGAGALTNCILWGNSPDQILDDSSSWTVSYSDIQGGFEGEENIAEDPLFVSPGSGDYHLGIGSLCIDAGDNDAPYLPGHDYEGDARIVDGDGDGEPVVDMGVDEVLIRVYLPLVLKGY